MSNENGLIPIEIIHSLDRLNAWFWSQTTLYGRNYQNVLSDINEIRLAHQLEPLILNYDSTRLLENNINLQ